MSKHLIQCTFMALVAVILSVAPAAGEDAPAKNARPLTDVQAADAILAALEAGDEARIRAVAAMDAPDPWLVADLLCSRGEHDAAAAYAKAAPRTDTEKLPAYVEAWRTREPDTAKRELLTAMIAAVRAGQPQRVIDGTANLVPALDTVLGLRLRGARTVALQQLRRLDEAREALAEFAEAAEKLGWLARASKLYGLAGTVVYRTSDYKGALVIFQKLLTVAQLRGDRHTATRALANIGIMHASLGEYAKALRFDERALAGQRALGDRAGVAGTLVNIGIVHMYLGDYALALRTLEQGLAEQKAVGNRAGAAAAITNIGSVYLYLGRNAEALQSFERALAEQRALGSRASAAGTLVNIGVVHRNLGDDAKALHFYEKALAEQETLGDRSLAAGTLVNIGSLHASLGDFAKALQALEQGHSEQKALGDRAAAAGTLLAIGLVHAGLGDNTQARRLYEQSARNARSLRATHLLVLAQTNLARLHLAMGKPSRALSAAQMALPEVEALVGGFGQEQAAIAREQHAELFAVGALAAAREEDAAEALTFLESGRAGALLDALDKREALRWKAESLSPELRTLDLEARAREQAARQAYDLAVKRGGDLEARRAAGRAVDEATDAVRGVAGRIQRELQGGMKQQAGLFYPRAKTIEEIEERLEPNQALVLYGLCLDEAVALVLRRDGERIVSLGRVSEIAAACAALEASDARIDAKPVLAKLQALLVEPLKLEADVEEVLISPEGPLCYVPFGALFPQTVAMTPSGTTHVLLLDEERTRGKGILALGAPDYGGVSEAARAFYHRGRPISPLPGTRKEVETIATKVLLGANASEAGLRKALPASPRWRAVHFACHGYVDIDRPMLSSLALSCAGDDDGFLTALEILRTKIPADLAVLSACETGRGRIVKGEGIVGLTRAFMFAGAPRVICSLWKVDDEATQALMIKFYELWNPKEGEGLGAAEALAKAQEHIRAQDKWKHPYYWAAWSLWGLPD